MERKDERDNGASMDAFLGMYKCYTRSSGSQPLFSPSPKMRPLYEATVPKWHLSKAKTHTDVGAGLIFEGINSRETNEFHSCILLCFLPPRSHNDKIKGGDYAGFCLAVKVRLSGAVCQSFTMQAKLKFHDL